MGVYWERNDWYDSVKERERLNADLWKMFLSEVRKRKVTFRWVRGHTGVEGNERADKLAEERLMFYKRSKS